MIAEYAAKQAENTNRITFEHFVNTVWFPSQMNETEHRASTIAFHTYLLKVINEYFGNRELRSITVKDIDFEYKTVRVQRNVTYTSKSGIVVGLPKSDCGLREIPLTENVLALLKRYRDEESPSAKDMFLFHASESQYEPHDPTYLTKHLKKFMKNAGLPDMSPHDLRHTCASILLQSGADIKSVQDILGHADASTTLNFYVKSDLDSMRGATEKAFGNAI